MKKLRLGVVGFGKRGKDILKNNLVSLLSDRVEIAAVCDIIEERAKAGAALAEEKLGGKTLALTDIKDVFALKPDAIIIITSWSTHIPLSIAAMEAGIPVACEIGGAYSIDDCFRLVHTYERTGTPYMFLENCCFGRLEQLALNMKNLGVLGKIVHCEGGYCHTLNCDIFSELDAGMENRHYRVSEYSARNCDNYPTHDFLPIAKVLDMCKGNRPLTLFSMASKQVAVSEHIAESGNTRFADLPINQGDVITTVIKFARGETVVLSLDTTLPRYYSRRFTVRGTKGSIFEDTKSVFIKGEHEKYDTKWNEQWGNVKEYYEKYESPMWEEHRKNPVGSHGGMDYLSLSAFLNCVENGVPMPISVYEAAFTMSITPLSEMSISTGLPVAFPDFTNGGWIRRYENETE